MLKLKKPLVVFDLETTGISTSNDKIVELYMIKLAPDGSREDMHKYVNPGRPIPPEVTAIHGISDEMVKDKPTFGELAPKIFEFIKGCDFGGFNSNKFDMPMLVEELMRVGIEPDLMGVKFVDAQRVFHKMEPRNLSAAYRYYCDKELLNAHSAKADTEATLEIILAQTERYSEFENTPEAIHEFTKQDQLVDLAGRFVRDPEGVVYFNFGKYRGKKFEEVMKKDHGYYDWMMRGEFPAQTKKVMSILKLKMSNG
jgi:DNA polymerase-3 subunit epsilon